MDTINVHQDPPESCVPTAWCPSGNGNFGTVVVASSGLLLLSLLLFFHYVSQGEVEESTSMNQSVEINIPNDSIKFAVDAGQLKVPNGN